MKVAIARDLMDLGLRDIYDLQGRAAETLFADIKKLREETPADSIRYYRMAIYFAEAEVADPELCHPDAWRD